MGILSYKPIIDKCIILTFFPYQYNLLEIDSWCLQDSLHIRIILWDLGTDHEYLLYIRLIVPHILIGASSSSNIGWDRKIYLTFKIIALIYPSNSLLSFDDFSVSLLIILSISIYSLWLILDIQYLNYPTIN